MFGKEKEREDYWNFQKIYTLIIYLAIKLLNQFRMDYIWNKENDKHKDKSRDDFEL